MKARIKATGEVVEVISIWDSVKSYYERLDVCDTKPIRYSEDELDFSDILGESYETTYTPDYWTRLEHQYAGMAMQGILSNQDYVHTLVQKVASREIHNLAEGITKYAEQLAHALVEKMKEERK
jgi:hypothetical protein